MLLMVLFDFGLEFGILKGNEAKVFQVALPVLVRIVVTKFTLHDITSEDSCSRPWTPHLAAQELLLDLQNVQILGELVVDLRARLGEEEAHFEVEMVRRCRCCQLLLQRLRRVQPTIGEILREIFDEQTEVFSLGRQIEIVEDFIEQIDAFATAINVKGSFCIVKEMNNTRVMTEVSIACNFECTDVVRAARRGRRRNV